MFSHRSSTDEQHCRPGSGLVIDFFLFFFHISFRKIQSKLISFVKVYSQILGKEGDVFRGLRLNQVTQVDASHRFIRILGAFSPLNIQKNKVMMVDFIIPMSLFLEICLEIYHKKIPFLGGGFKHFSFSPRKLGKIFTHFDGVCIFFRMGWFKTTKLNF